MTQLIESSSTIQSPGSSDKEGQPVHKKVHERFIPYSLYNLQKLHMKHVCVWPHVNFSFPSRCTMKRRFPEPIPVQVLELGDSPRVIRCG